jgi:hypothetical protein
MAVTVKTTRKTVEIGWETSGSPEEPPVEEKPPGVPTHPIYLPPYVDNTLPGDQPRPDNTLPGDQPRPDHELPGDQPSVEHPIYLPPYIDNSLPGPQPRPEHPIVLPPDIEEGIPPEKLEAIKEFLLGNLPPYEGAPEYPAPVSEGEALAVQVFAQGQEGDWSNTAVMPNDGLAALTYPQDFKGESYIEVRALDGSLVDSGTIKVK